MLDQRQIDSFHRDGFLVMPGVIQGRELALLREVSASIVADGCARRGDGHLYLPGENGVERYWRSEEMWARHPIFRAVTVHPALLENIGQCIGHEFFPWNDSLVVKTAGGPACGWHQDPPYLDPARATTYVIPNFTTDIYLDDSDEGNGCVWAIPGHHLVGNVNIDDKSQEELFLRCGAVPIRMKAGDVLFHCLSTPHGSGANPSQRMRRTFYIHYLAQEVHDECGYRPDQTGWVVGKHWWGDEKRAQLARMAADREALGLGAAFSEHIREGEEGLRFTGAVRTPRRHWWDVGQRIPAVRRAQMKALMPQAVAVA